MCIYIYIITIYWENDENDDQTQDSQVFPKFSGGNVLSSFFLDSNFPSLPNLPRNCWWTLLMKARFPFVWQSLQWAASPYGPKHLYLTTDAGAALVDATALTAAFTVKSQPSSAISISQCISKKIQKHPETTTHTMHVWPRYLQGGIPEMTYTDEIKRSQEAVEGTHSLWRTYSKGCAKKNIVEQPGIVNYSSEILFICFSGRTLSGRENSDSKLGNPPTMPSLLLETTFFLNTFWSCLWLALRFGKDGSLHISLKSLKTL